MTQTAFEAARAQALKIAGESFPWDWNEPLVQKVTPRNGGPVEYLVWRIESYRSVRPW